MRDRRWAPLAAGAGLVVLLVVVGIVVARPAPRELGSDFVRPLAFDVVLRHDEEVCQPVEYVPVGTAGVELRIGTYGRSGPSLSARIAAERMAPATGRLAPGWEEGDVVIPVQELGRARERSSVCVRNDGRSRIALAGHSLTAAQRARVDGRATGTSVRIEYVRADDGSWISRIGSIASRVAATREAVPGSTSFWLWMAIALLVLGGAVVLVLRDARE